MSRPQSFRKPIHQPEYTSFSQLGHTEVSETSKNQKSLISKRRNFTSISTQTTIQSNFEEQVYELRQELQKKNNLLSMMKKKLASECINYNKQMNKLQQVLAMYMYGRKQSKKSFMYEVGAIIEKIEDTGHKIKEEDSDDRNSEQFQNDLNHHTNTVKKEQAANKAMKDLQLPSLTDNDEIESRDNLDDSHYYNRSAIEVERSQHQRQHSYQDYSTPYEPVSYQIARHCNVSQSDDSHYSFKGSHVHKINEQKHEDHQNKQVYVKFNANQTNHVLSPQQNGKPNLHQKTKSSEFNQKIPNKLQSFTNHVHIKETKKRSNIQKKYPHPTKINQIRSEQKSILKIEKIINPDHSFEPNASSQRKKSPKSQKSRKSLQKTQNNPIKNQTPIQVQISHPQNLITSNLSISKPISFLQTPKTLKAPFIEKCKEYEVRKNKYTYSSTKRFQFLELCLNEKDVNFSAIIKIGLFDVSRIQMLSLANNFIADQQLKMLVNFKWLSLTSLNLWGNQIMDIEPIQKLDLSKLFELSISWNPLNKQSAEFLSKEVSFQKTKNDEYLSIMTTNQLKNFPSIGTLKIFESQEISQSTKRITRFLVQRYCKEKAKIKKMGRLPKIKLIWELSRQEYESRLERYAASSCTSVVNVQELSPLQQKELSQALSGKIMKSGKKLNLSPGKGKSDERCMGKTKTIKKIKKEEKDQNKKQSKLVKFQGKDKIEKKDKDSLVSDT